ncbi:hypothetical protein [Reinekea thalattae]|uniref:M15 family metallopeptidase n=1 Tax=Reinekea thalattae TaxID=2593301 RepID=A0A5C8Z583_9GAMM|nr:hypothetical protein [Reinekea thalattae]TXR52066.1 hypothetical protein FME95_11665 [Reinekea thalattae]
MQTVNLKYFTPSEFRTWWPNMDDDLLYRLDAFREEIGRAIIVSPAAGALGRLGSGNSYHNVLTWGKVRAVDVMFPNATEDDLKGYYAVAVEYFGGVGVYPDWLPYAGFHLDNRDTSATWSGILVNDKQVYRGVSAAWA